MADIQRIGQHREAPPNRRGSPNHRRRAILAATVTVLIMVLAVGASIVAYHKDHPKQAQHFVPKRAHSGLSTTPESYIGLYPDGAPHSYVGVKTFTTATGVKPTVVVYYSGWMEPFQVSYATTAAKSGAVPLVQIDPSRVSVSAIANGRYDSYLRDYAKAIRQYHHPVILSFGHEMNGYWYSWGYTHTPPAVFVAAWRHIVTLFRTLRAQNVTWLWTINTIHKRTRVPSPGPWWPGKSYVNWVGIDGYYVNSSSVFASVFGPTIVFVRTLTRAPILIAETSATPSAGQPAKIADLFSGVHLYGLLGFVWFNIFDKEDWRLNSPAAIAAFRRYTEMYHGYAS